MKTPFFHRTAILGLLAMIFGPLGLTHARAAAEDRAQNTAVDTSSKTSAVVGCANTFLATLDEKQKARILFAFDDKEQRARWSNFPTMVVPRAGLNLYELNEAQRSAALALVASVLSQRGLEKVQQIREADEAFKTTDHGPGGHGGPPRGEDKDHGPGGPPHGDGPGGDHGRPPFGGGGGPGHGGPPPGGFNLAAQGGSLFGRNLYYLSILGTPSETAPWMLQFGGHHLALNITMAGGRGVITPTLTGSQPATFTTPDGKTVRPLGTENDKGFALLNALDDRQRKQAILNYRVADLVLGPGHDGETIPPEGLKASAMNETQRALLLDLISEWSGIVNDQFAAARMTEIKAGLDETWFAWSGPTTPEPGKKNGTAYYRIQGPKLVIEFAPQHEEDHVHTMYRDPTNDYGRAFLGDAR